MNQPRKLPQRRLSMRRNPKRTSRVVCRKGVFGMGPNLALRLLDIPETGARLVVKAEISPRQEVEVVISPPGGGREIVRKGAVVWAVPTAEGEFCVGVRFDKR